MGHFVVYVRRSYRQGDDADVSDEAQVSAALAMLPAGSTHDVLADSGGHQSGRTDDREAFRELVRRVEARSCEGVAVYDLSRLARNARLTLNLHHALERAGIPLLIANMPNTRWDTATGRFMLGQLALAAQFQADMDSERARGIRQALYEDGRHRGQPPFGYRNGKDETGRRVLLVDTDSAATVRRIFERLAERSFAEVADELVADGAPAPTANGWTRYTVRDVFLRAKTYRGLAVRGRGLEERPGRHEAIITAELERAAIAAVRGRSHDGRRRSGSPRVYLLSGVLVCDCGRRMTGNLSGGGPYYACRWCRRPMVRAETLEELVLERIRRYRLPARDVALMREELLRRLAGPADDSAVRHRRRLAHRLEALRKQHGWGDIDDATYRRERTETETLLAQLPDEDKIVAFDRYSAQVLDMAAAIDAMTPAERRRTVALFVERVSPAGEILWAGPVRPFYALAAGGEGPVSGVSPEGSSRTADTADTDPLAWFAERSG